TYTSVHSEARSWSIPSEDPYEEATQYIPSEDPYEEAAQQLLDQAPLYILEHPEDLLLAEDEAPIEAYIPKVASVPTPPLPPSFLSPWTPPLLPIPLPVPSTSRRAEIPEADMPPQKMLLLTAPKPGCEVGESSTAAAARQPGPTMACSVDCSFVDTMETRESSKFYSRHHDAQKDRAAVRAEIEVLYFLVIKENGTKENHKALINRGVVAAMAEAEASRVRNGNDSNGSGTRLAQAIRECTYPDFLKSQPLNFKGTEGVVGLTHWFEKIESIFNNCTTTCQVNYAACTLKGVALKWWNSYVKTVTLEVTQALPWKTLKKMITDKVDKYIGGLPDTIHDSVKAAMPKTMQEEIKFATELMDKRIRDVVENKRKFDGTSGNNQNQPQQNKRQNTSRAYAAGNSDRNIYT
nr:hypothetical protein [Tanacetum cinerariifolium]